VLLQGISEQIVRFSITTNEGIGQGVNGILWQPSGRT
jgi:hypothetical protein